VSCVLLITDGDQWDLGCREMTVASRKILTGLGVKFIIFAYVAGTRLTSHQLITHWPVQGYWSVAAAAAILDALSLSRYCEPISDRLACIQPMVG
jgi:hypothetical protein